MDDTVVVGKSADVIAVPYRDAQTWHELRDAACVVLVDLKHEVFGPSQPLPPDTAKDPARFWIGEHRAELRADQARRFHAGAPLTQGVGGVGSSGRIRAEEEPPTPADSDRLDPELGRSYWKDSDAQPVEVVDYH